MKVCTSLYSFLWLLIIMTKNYLCKDIRDTKITQGGCKRCQVLIKSFNYWLDKTSRGKYEGGDTAWEEAKLKSYARSEIRLVEIQEGLCSELKSRQDECYALAEEAEQLLETWWFNRDPETVDLQTWLCIENLKYCCPDNHFGELCTACLLDKDNKVCGGQGKCDGEGTRQGNGTCICNKGYSGVICDHCSQNYYIDNESCQPCHEACDGCSNLGPSACKRCNSGWVMEEGVCVDFNECTNKVICKQEQYCVNSLGSYYCKSCDNSCKTCSGNGAANCTSCYNNIKLWSGICIDDKLKSEFISNALRRLALYSGFIIITFFISNNLRPITPFIVLLIAIFIYYSEKSSRINIINSFMFYIS